MYSVDMNIWCSPLTKALVIVLPLALCGAFWAKSRPREPRLNIVGKWRAISHSDGIKNIRYEFFADGRYTNKFSSLQLGGSGVDTFDYWYDENYSGRYELSPDNIVTVGTESAAWNGGHPERVDTNSASGDLGSYSSFKLRVSGDHIIANSQETGQDAETWYRIKVGTVSAKASRRRNEHNGRTQKR